jgi:HD-like signal output (HDOD) protein
MGGLLHDIGKLVLASRFADSYRHIGPQSRRQHVPVWRVETERYGASHAEVGAYLLGCWGLPRIIVEAVAYHHQPSLLRRTHFDPVGAVHVAESLVQEMDAPVGQSGDDKGSGLDSAYLDSTNALGRMRVFRDIARDVARRV